VSGAFNPLVAIPGVIVVIAVLSPLLFLDGGSEYLAFLWRNPTLVVLTVGTWWVSLYWVTRQLASVLLLRSSGAKLRVGNAAQP